MVEVKREDITLQDWTKGISADEFAGGSYFYSEAISSGYNTKGFELWNYFYKTEINKRGNGYVTALSTAWGNGFTAFTADGRIEMETDYNGTKKGAYYAIYNSDTYKKYLNGVSYGNYLFGIRQTTVEKIPAYNFPSSTQKLTNPWLTTTTGWTFGTWWTATDGGAEHTTGNTATLVSDNISGTYTTDDRFRFAVKVTNRTAWSFTLESSGSPAETFNFQEDGRYVATLRWYSGGTNVTITPSSAFDGTIERAELYQYNLTNYASINLTWGTESDHHPALVREGDLYVACGSYMNIINLGDNGVVAKQLIDANFKIVSMNQQAGNIILRATDGYDSRQYYWNWVDAAATEVIEWKWLIIQCATGTETISYVLTTSGRTVGTVEGYEYRLYAVSGYQRNLIASKLYQYRSDDYLDAPHYNANKKFDFNDVTDEHGMIVFLDSLYIPGCDGVYKYGYDVPGLRSNWTRPIKYDTGATNIVMGQRGHFLGIAIRSGNINYIWNVENRLYQAEGYLVTESIYWDKLSTRKALEKLKIWYKNVASTVGKINIYAIVDDTYFWRFRPTATPTTRPTVGAIYNIANNTTGEVINVDQTNGIITFRTKNDTGSYANLANTTLTKVSGTGDNSIAVWYNYDNMCLIKTIESDQQAYGSDLIFGKNFVNNYIPFWHKIQFVIELRSNDYHLSPEIYEISMNSDITDVTL